MRTAYLNERRIELPEQWSEVPLERLPRLVDLLYTQPESGEVYHEVLRLAMGFTRREWTRLSRGAFGASRSEAVKRQNAETLQELLAAVAWMWTDDLTVRPFEALHLPDGTRLLLPEEGFRTMTFGELTDAYIHLLAFTRQLVPGTERMYRLLATVCRPERSNGLLSDYRNAPDYNGDPREPYNEHRVRGREPLVARVGKAEQVAALMYFVGSLKDFLAHYDIYDGDDADAQGDEDYPGQGLVKNAHLLAQKGIFGNLVETRVANVHDVFLFLEENHKDEKARREAEDRQDRLERIARQTSHR